MNNITLISPLFYKTRYLKDIDVERAFMFVSASDVRSDKTISVEKLHACFNTYKKGFVVHKSTDKITCITLSDAVGFKVETFDIDMVCYPLKVNKFGMSIELALS
jgi:hypothetical protein